MPMATPPRPPNPKNDQDGSDEQAAAPVKVRRAQEVNMTDHGTSSDVVDIAQEVEADEADEAPSPSRSDVIRALRRTRGQARSNAKKTRMAFKATKEISDTGQFRTKRMPRVDES